MRGEWKVRKVKCEGRESWEVYRLIDKNAPLTPTNKESLAMDYATKDEAKTMADKLNAEH